MMSSVGLLINLVQVLKEFYAVIHLLFLGTWDVSCRFILLTVNLNLLLQMCRYTDKFREYFLLNINVECESTILDIF